ncbi:MAG: alpha/beta hydrolase [Pseudomonadota bacterium]
MSVRHRNNVSIHGTGSTTVVFAHGFGCDQAVWRFISPAFAERYRILAFDLVGSGGSDLAAYDRARYGSLHGYADDLLDILDEFADGPVIYIGHSVSAMIGMLAGIKAPERFLAQVMLAPSPCYINEDGYIGGFTRGDIDELLETMDANYLGWSSNVAPIIMGAPNAPQLAAELTHNFCRNDPDIARHFARVTFLSDHRADLPRVNVPTLIVQCSDDLIAPREVGDYLHRHIPGSRLHVLPNIGHCPHMSAPEESARAALAFLAMLEARA